MNKQNIYERFVIPLFFIALIINQYILNKEVSSFIFVLSGVILALFRAVYFNMYFNTSKIVAILMFATFSIFTYMHKSNEIADLVLIKYLYFAAAISLTNILMMIYIYYNSNNAYIFNTFMYILITIFMTVEYVPEIINIIEIINLVIFFIIYQVLRKVKSNGKK